MNILILENDLKTLSLIFKVLNETKIDFIPVVLSTFEQVEKLINPSDLNFDLILLDRNCSLGGTFHVLDIAKFGPEKVIGISSVSNYNEDLIKRGVKTIITKNYEDLDKFASDLSNSISDFVNKH